VQVTPCTEGTSAKANAPCTRGSLRENKEEIEVMSADIRCWCTCVPAELGRVLLSDVAGTGRELAL
jgi:hypothetical protein